MGCIRLRQSKHEMQSKSGDPLRIQAMKVSNRKSDDFDVLIDGRTEEYFDIDLHPKLFTIFQIEFDCTLSDPHVDVNYDPLFQVAIKLANPHPSNIYFHSGSEVAKIDVSPDLDTDRLVAIKQQA